jgi:hypothetical protein
VQSMEATDKPCHNEGCNKVATQQCPTCKNLKLPMTRFCSKECFKACWKTHKKVLRKPNGEPKFWAEGKVNTGGSN